MAKKKNIAQELSINKPTYGFMFIGDPHVWSLKPGRRRDNNYLETIIGKLRFCAEYCNKQNLWPVILGDLLHESTDNDLVMLNSLMTTLKLFERTPLVLVGNHDLTEKSLTPDTALYLLNNSQSMLAMTQNAPFAIIEMSLNNETKRVLIGSTPYGEEIPISLSRWAGIQANKTHDEIKESLNVDRVVWVTHEDLSFDKHYPNTLSIHPIKGVDIAVNGHMHNKQKPIMKGDTAWYNPGNISRITIDLINQIPSVTTWSPFNESMVPGADGIEVYRMDEVVIPHIPGNEILSLEGRIAVIEDKKTEIIATNESVEETRKITSSFVEQIQNDEVIAKTDDGAFLAKAIEEELNLIDPPKEVQEIIKNLFQQSIADYQAKKQN